MALVIADRVRETSTTAGTGTFTLDGAVTGYQTFSSAIGNGNTTYYVIANSQNGEWEVGVGTVGAGTLARTTLLSSSTGSAVDFAVGDKDVFVSLPAIKLINNDLGTLNVAHGGTGVTNLTGLVKGNGTSAFTAATAGTDYVTPSGSETLSNKRITQRVNNNGATTSGTITPTGDSSDQYELLGLTGAITVAAPSGTPTAGQKLVLRFKDNGTGQGITWTTSSGGYRAIGVTLPTTTTAGKVTYVGCIYNATDTYWDVIAVTTQA